MRSDLKKLLLDLASAPYRRTGRFNYYWARGKLAADPIFVALLEQAVFSPGFRVLDLGSGRGLLSAWFLAAEQLGTQGRWPAPVMPPQGLRFRGVELMAREVDCGIRALHPVYGERVQLTSGDMRLAELRDVEAIAILDALHYIPYAEQDLLVDRIHAALRSGGLFVTRVGDAGGGMRFFLSQIVDRVTTFMQGHRLARMWCRPLPAWISLLRAKGFAVEVQPMSAGTPFANFMLVARVP
ncbi:MAG: SAM-dependent methyltransferase [Sulfuricaulis sp.]